MQQLHHKHICSTCCSGTLVDKHLDLTSNDNSDAALVPTDTMHKLNMPPCSCVADVVTSAATPETMYKCASPNMGTSKSAKKYKNQCTGIKKVLKQEQFLQVKYNIMLRGIIIQLITIGIG